MINKIAFAFDGTIEIQPTTEQRNEIPIWKPQILSARNKRNVSDRRMNGQKSALRWENLHLILVMQKFHLQMQFNVHLSSDDENQNVKIN